MMHYQVGVPYHPCSPSALAKAARGADFCRLQLPSFPENLASAKSVGESAFSEGIGKRPVKTYQA